MYTKRRFGIEIECIGPCQAETGAREVLKQQLQQRTQLPLWVAQQYGHETRVDAWKIMGDSSVHPIGERRGGGHEICSRPLRQTDEVEAVMRALQALRYHVNRTCGMHVHIEARADDGSPFGTEEMTRLMKLWLIYEHSLNTLVPVQRRTSNYAPSVRRGLVELLGASPGATLPELFTYLDRSGRFYPDLCQRWALNPLAFWRHGTVEFRLPQGSLDPETAISWIHTADCMVAMACKLDHPLVARELTLDHMIKTMRECLPDSIPPLTPWRPLEPGRLRQRETTNPNRARPAPPATAAQAGTIVYDQGDVLQHHVQAQRELRWSHINTLSGRLEPARTGSAGAFQASLGARPIAAEEQPGAAVPLRQEIMPSDPVTAWMKRKIASYASAP